MEIALHKYYYYFFFSIKKTKLLALFENSGVKTSLFSFWKLWLATTVTDLLNQQEVRLIPFDPQWTI